MAKNEKEARQELEDARRQARWTRDQYDGAKNSRTRAADQRVNDAARALSRLRGK